MKHNRFKLNINPKIIGLVFTTIILSIPQYTKAAGFDFGKFLIDNTVGRALSNLLGAFKEILLKILSEVVMPLLTNVLSYTNFFSTGVNAGWTIVRDFANLFFALTLLIIAIATVLQVSALDNYTAKRMLPSFIFVALFINFSKAIVGFFLDISQIIMITFYNAFGPGLADAISKASKFSEASSNSNMDVATLNMLVIVIIAVLIATLLWTALILAVRVATLWVIIMMSPVAFLGMLIPALKGITDDWKTKLQEALVTGPTLMFLLYLTVTVMNNGLSSTLQTTGGDNLFNNGNVINFAFVIILLFLSNTIAMKAGQSAPPMLQKAVGIGTTLATFGAGKYVGAGGYGTGTMLKTGKNAVTGAVKGTMENVDKVKGGATRAVQVVSGGKYNLNDRYEMRKAKAKKKLEEGKAFGGGYWGSVAQQTAGGEAGRKAKYKETLLGLAEEAKKKNTLNENPELKKAYNDNIIAETKKLADADTSVPELIKKLDETVESTAKKAILMRITQLQGLAELASNERYADIVKEAENDSEILEGILNRELNDGELDAEDISFRDRLSRVAKDKKQERFVLGINEVETYTDSDGRVVKKTSKSKEYAKKDKDEVRNLSIKSMGTELKKKRDRFTRREQIGTDPDNNPIWATENGKAKRTLDLTIFTNAIEKADHRVLRDPETWTEFDYDTKEKIKDHIQKIQNKTPNQEAALQGLGTPASSSRVTSNLT